MLRLLARVAALAAALVVLGCDDDGPVLWQAQGGEPPTSTGEPMGGGGADPVGGGEGPGLPPMGGPQDCAKEADGGMPCTCVPEVPCTCGDADAPAMECSMSCPEGACNLSCASAACNADCASGCFVECESFTSCTVGCEQGCTVICHEGASCTLWSWQDVSEIYCAPGAMCDCAIPGNCACSGAGCMF